METARKVLDGLTGLVAAAMAAALGGAFVRYAGLDGFLDHAEPDAAILAWRLVIGEPLYAPPDSAAYILTAYGPLFHLINAAWLAALGGTLAAGKAGGIAASAMAAIVLALTLRRRLGNANTALGLVYFLGILLAAGPIAFWTRPDPHLVLLVTLALAATLLPDTGRGYRARLVLVAAVAGLAVNLKIHAALYFVPLVLRHASRDPLRDWPLMAVVAVAAVLLPFAMPGVSLVSYVTTVQGVVGARAIDGDLLRLAAKYALLFLAPLLPALVAAGNGTWRRISGPDRLYAGSLAACIVISLYPAAVPGAGWYHLLPFAPLAVDAGLRLLVPIAPESRWRLATRAALLVAFAIVTITPQKRLHRQIAAIDAEAPALVAEVSHYLRATGTRPLEMGFGADAAGTYRRTLVRPMLAFAGHPVTLSAVGAMEATFSGRPAPAGKIAHVAACKSAWLIPHGEAPFRMQSFFTGGPTFWPELVAAFDAAYERRVAGRYFDLWECRGR